MKSAQPKDFRFPSMSYGEQVLDHDGSSGSLINGSVSARVQVSSVDFNQLKKQNSNSSHASSLATQKSKSLALNRLFTRNRTLENSEGESLKASEEIADVVANKQSNKSKSTRKSISRLSFSKASNEPELQVQTAGHHKLKIPRKILTPSKSEEKSVKKTNSSPVSLSSIFHRPHSQVVVDYPGKPENVDLESHQANYNGKPRRATISLSSQSSNSSVVDANLAAVFKFTNPDYNGASEEISDNSSFNDFHRLYMISADQFIQKSHKQAISSHGGSNCEKYQYDSSNLEAYLNKTLSQLFSMIKPFLTPSKQTLLPSGKRLLPLSFSVEQIASFASERLLNIYAEPTRHIETAQDEYKGRSSFEQQNEKTQKTSCSESMQEFATVDEDFLEVRTKELESKLYFFFVKCCQTLAKDLEIQNADLSCTPPSALIALDAAEISISTSIDNYFSSWISIVRSWKYFDFEVRHAMLHIFLDIELHFESCSRGISEKKRSKRENKIGHNILQSFRDTFVIPQLRFRATLASASFLEHDLQRAESIFFQMNYDSVWKPLAKCFGIITSNIPLDYTTADDLQTKDKLFIEFINCFNTYAKHSCL